MDSPRERDQSVERLLRRSLETPKPGGATGSCLDGETLAAWASNGLSVQELEAARSHVADCARCQELVGTLARIDSAVSQEEPAPASRRWLAWLVPLTAAAAAVALWVAVPGHKPTINDRSEVAEAVDRSPVVAPQVQSTPEPRRQVAEPKPRESKPAIVSPRPSAVVREPQNAAAPEASSNKDAVQAPAAASGTLKKEEGPVALARSAARFAPVARVEIVSPDPSVRWRIARSTGGAVIERTTDGGSTWEAAPSGITTELTAGAAPSPSVCWLVGRGGVVLLTTDGRTWQRLGFPEVTDLTAVRASDAAARAASVSTADGRTFTTTDGGLTWEPQ